MALPLLHRSHAPRWGVYEHAPPAQPPAAVEVFTAVVVQDQQVFSQTGDDLSNLLHDLWRPFEHAKSASPRAAFYKANDRPAAWVVPDSQCLTFEWACLPSWGPQDIDAECRVEASLRMQLAVDEVALDFRVHQPSKGNLQITVMAYELIKIKTRVAQMKALGFDLQVFTAQNQWLGLASFFRHSFKSQKAMQERMTDQAALFLRHGQVPC